MQQILVNFVIRESNILGFFLLKQLPLIKFFIYYISSIITKLQAEQMAIEALIEQALEQRNFARASFSNFRVGAILVTQNNEIYSGCNIETSSYGLTICAERVAIFKAVSEGETEFKSIFIASDSDKFTPPCGACRQVLWELAGNIDVFMINRFGEHQKRSMKELLPLGFDKSFLT